jgi:DNA invertase Pin-like site-specific DNA recombinase
MFQFKNIKTVRGIESIKKAAYTAYTDWMDRTGIADQSIQQVKNVYSQTPVLPILFITVGVWLLGSSRIPSEYLLLMLPGLMSREEVLGLAWGVIGRVSTGVQHNSNSTDLQIEDVNRERKRANGEKVCEYDLAESGTSIERESLDEVARRGEEGIIDVLGVSKFDRLMRADPWKSLEYLRRLKEANVILYVDTHGYFDYDDLYDFQSLVRQVVFAREWLERLKENAEEGQIRKLENGRYPFGKPPYGYGKRAPKNADDDDDEDMLFLIPGYDEVLSAMFKIYQEKKCLSDVADVVEQQYDVNKPSDHQVGEILENQLCLGELTLTGTVIARKPELAVVDKETFQDVQAIRYDQRPKSGEAQAVPEAVNRAAREFGAEYVNNLVGSIQIRCRKCGSKMRKNGTEEHYDTTVQKYRCKNDDCRYQSPLLTKNEFEKLHGTLPTRCPWCPSTGAFDITSLPNSNWAFKYNCKVCDSTFAADKVEGKYERAANNPDLEFSWFKDGPRESLKFRQSEGQGSVDAPEGQSELTNFDN